jgi:hypothetical protein
MSVIDLEICCLCEKKLINTINIKKVVFGRIRIQGAYCIGCFDFLNQLKTIEVIDG